MVIEQRIARGNLKIIIDNIMKFPLKETFQSKVNSFNSQKGEFTSNQLSLVDGLYEKYMKAGGFGSIGVKHDFKRK